jgi:hypothetical protein
MRPIEDEHDAELVRRRMAILDARPGARVGDFVRFANGVERRIAYLWKDGAQTSDSGSFYLSESGCAFSGSLHPPVPLQALVTTTERRAGTVWVFRRDIPRAGNAVTAWVEFRVFGCVLAA